MKKAYSIVLLLPFVIACPHNSKIENHKIVDSLAEYRDTIVGNFSGLGIDTLIAEPNTVKGQINIKFSSPKRETTVLLTP